MMKTSVVKTVQSLLKKECSNIGKIDGHAGKKTKVCLDKALKKRKKKVPSGWKDWPKTRKMTAYIQLVSAEKDIDSGVIDGYWGQITDYAYESLVYLMKHGKKPPLWRDDTPLDKNPNNWPKQKKSALNKFYGKVVVQTKKPKIYLPSRYRTMINLPYPHRLAWDKRQKVTKTTCNKKVAKSIVRVLTKVLKHYGMKEIKRLGLDLYGGCYAPRKMRGGSSLSTHSWAMALDYNPTENKLRWGRDKARFAQPEYDKWWEFWEEEGWVSLGREKNYDWMHIQAAKL